MRSFPITACLIVMMCLPAAGQYETVRLCVGAGSLFPETEEGLRGAVTRLLDEADAPAPTVTLPL